MSSSIASAKTALVRATAIGLCALLLALTAPAQAMLPPEPEELTALPAAALERLQAEVIDRARGSERRLELLIGLLFGVEGLGLQYAFEPTLTAAEAFAAGSGNCLSFTLLFLAMAEAAGIDANARELTLAADWRRDGNALFEAGHMNVQVRTELRRLIVDFAPVPAEPDAATTRSARLIPIERVKAHFYNNRSAEFLAAGEASTARQWNERALDLAPDLMGALNNRGVIEARLGRLDLAEDFYRRALAIEPDNVNALFNLLNLYQRNARSADATTIRARLETLNPRDPYFQWALGRQFETDGDFEQALGFFQRAVRLQPADPMLQLSLAGAAAALNRERQAERALSHARELIRQNELDQSARPPDRRR